VDKTDIRLKPELKKREEAKDTKRHKW
jgi:hypothetical protein